jgi:hypothetical protein
LYYGGLDLAKTEDFTVLAIGQERAHATEPKSRIHVVHLDRFHRLDWNVQVARVKGVADRFDHAQLLVDSTGKGEPVFEALRHAGCSVKPFTFTQANKADLIANAVILLEQGRVVLPRPELCPYVVEELENFESTQSETGTERMGAPSGQHDDAVIAVLLCLWQLRPYRRRGGIFIVDTPF